MNPFVAGTNTGEEEESLPYLKEFAWDFKEDCFLFNADGTHEIVTENEALKVWVYKALKTERYRFECYMHGEYDTYSDYGVELEEYIGRRKNDARAATEIEQRIKECLLVNPYIRKINSIDILEIDGDKLTIGVSLTSIYGSMTQEVNL